MVASGLNYYNFHAVLLLLLYKHLGDWEGIGAQMKFRTDVWLFVSHVLALEIEYYSTLLPVLFAY